jgi:hypothetical protein
MKAVVIHAAKDLRIEEREPEDSSGHEGQDVPGGATRWLRSGTAQAGEADAAIRSPAGESPRSGLEAAHLHWRAADLVAFTTGCPGTP